VQIYLIRVFVMSSLSHTPATEKPVCVLCGKKSIKSCNRCKKQIYCSVDCQTNDGAHKKWFCNPNVEREQIASSEDQADWDSDSDDEEKEIAVPVADQWLVKKVEFALKGLDHSHIDALKELKSMPNITTDILPRLMSLLSDVASAGKKTYEDVAELAESDWFNK